MGSIFLNPRQKNDQRPTLIWGTLPSSFFLLVRRQPLQRKNLIKKHINAWLASFKRLLRCPAPQNGQKVTSCFIEHGELCAHSRCLSGSVYFRTLNPFQWMSQVSCAVAFASDNSVLKQIWFFCESFSHDWLPPVTQVLSVEHPAPAQP